MNAETTHTEKLVAALGAISGVDRLLIELGHEPESSARLALGIARKNIMDVCEALADEKDLAK